MKTKPQVNKNQPIGVFDSGIGGLTVLHEIVKLLPHEDTIYIGDTARVPYGIKSRETVTRYSRELSTILIDKGVKLIVVACNSASAYALEHLRDALAVPVIGVIEPGAQKAAGVTKTKQIGVIGTEATISTSAYPNAIRSIDDSIEVKSRSCPLFVSLAEEGWTDNNIADEVAKKYLSIYKTTSGGAGDNRIVIDTLVLGCTHYPLLKNTISNIMGSDVTLIDSAVATAEKVMSSLREKNLLNDKTGAPEHDFYVTDSTERFKKIGGSFFGSKLSKVELLKI